VLSAAAMRAVEEAHGDLGALMERAGAGVADAARRVSGGAEVLVLCGPGNNGGDGYVAARVLREQGHAVRVAALCAPRSGLAREAAARWGGPVRVHLEGDPAGHEPRPWRGGEVAPAPILVDALFGTGGRPDGGRPAWLGRLQPLFDRAGYRIAADLPSHADAEGRPTIRDADFRADLTLALGALKPVHVLPGACGRVRLVDLGLAVPADAARVMGRPDLPVPNARSHKFNRGTVAVVAGAMPGAALLAATAAQRAGAGYVTLHGGAAGGPAALVRRPAAADALADERIDTVVIGPGLGRDERARDLLHAVWETPRTLVVDGDALRLLDEGLVRRTRDAPVILTPHAGEYADLKDRFGIGHDPAVSYAERSAGELGRIAGGGRFVLVEKGSTTAVTDGRRTLFAPGGDPWLSTAGSGDVLAGAVGAMAAAYGRRGGSPLDAAAAGVWLHGRAARLCGPAFVADDLADALGRARA